MHRYFIALSVKHPSLSHSNLIKPSEVLSDGTGHITTRVHPQGSHSFTRREGDECADMIKPSVTRGNITYRMFGTFLELPTIAILAKFTPIENYRTSRRFLENTDIGVRLLTGYSQNYRTSGRFFGKGQHLSLVNYLELENLPNIREVFSKVPTSEFRHLSRICKPAEHPRSFTIGTFFTDTTLCIHSSHSFAELLGSTGYNLSSMCVKEVWTMMKRRRQPAIVQIETGPL